MCLELLIFTNNVWSVQKRIYIFKVSKGLTEDKYLMMILDIKLIHPSTSSSETS